MDKNLIDNIDLGNIPTHIAIIMDGNRRWAVEKGMDKIDGHKYGAQALENVAKYCNEIGIKYFDNIVY